MSCAVVAFAVAGCTIETESVDAPVDERTSDELDGDVDGDVDVDVEHDDATGELDDEFDDDAGDEFDDPVPADGVADCDPVDVGEELGEVETIYAVVDGELAGPCFGPVADVLVDAWSTGEAVTPPDDLSLISLWAGFDGDGRTLAFAGPLDASHDEFVIAIDLDTAANDPDELNLTVVHEYAHVITQTTEELDVLGDPDACETLWNGSGCFWDDSYVFLWVEDWWPDSYLADLPPDGSEDEEGGLERCDVDRTFLGAYSASSPEEDFAETFSAFVFGLDVPPGVQPKIDWLEQFPELLEYRERRADADLPIPANNFDICG